MGEPEENLRALNGASRADIDATLDALRRLLEFTRPGRPRGTGVYQSRQEFLDAVRKACAGGRLSQESLAGALGCSNSAMKRYRRAFGFASYDDLLHEALDNF